MPASKTIVVAYMTDAIGAMHSNIRTWLRHDGQMARLGHPSLLTDAEEAKIAKATELSIAIGGLLTR